MSGICNRYLSAKVGILLPMTLVSGRAADIGRSAISNAALVTNIDAMWAGGRQAVQRGAGLPLPSKPRWRYTSSQ